MERANDAVREIRFGQNVRSQYAASEDVVPNLAHRSWNFLPWNSTLKLDHNHSRIVDI